MGIATDYHDMLAAVLLRQFHELSLETELGLSWEEARVLHQAKIGTISALRERLDEVLRFRIRNMGKQLQEEILAALDAWEARQPP